MMIITSRMLLSLFILIPFGFICFVFGFITGVWWEER